jgi:hypothetical protein
MRAAKMIGLVPAVCLQVSYHRISVAMLKRLLKGDGWVFLTVFLLACVSPPGLVAACCDRETERCQGADQGKRVWVS